jgi:integrase/recombinase XerD
MTMLRQAIDSYLALRRSLGFKLRDTSICLGNFAHFMEERHADYVSRELAVEWATQPRNALASTWAQRLGYVRGLAEYQSATDPRTEIPERGLLPCRRVRPQPHIYSDEEVQRLLDGAKSLTPEDSLRPHTYYCFFGLLVVTGLRTSEALNLKREDVDLSAGVLTIRQTKFGKSRLVPVHSSTQEKLAEYATRRDTLLRTASEPRFFINEHGRALCPDCVWQTFREVGLEVGLWRDTDRRKPRLHDLRHTLAVRTLIAWYGAGEDIDRRLPALSTFLGHGRVEDTYWYLSFYPELRKLAADRFEKRWEGLS